MKCNRGTPLVCYCYERCKYASTCPNVLIGIRKKLQKEEMLKSKKQC